MADILHRTSRFFPSGGGQGKQLGIEIKNLADTFGNGDCRIWRDGGCEQVTGELLALTLTTGKSDPVFGASGFKHGAG